MATNKEIVQQINDAFSNADLDGFLNHCADNVRWTIAGKEPIVGKEAITAFMGKMPAELTMKFKVHNVIADGALVACAGYMEMPNSNGSMYRAEYCDVYRFEGGKVVELTSYVVELKP